MQTDDILLKPATAFAFLKSFSLILLSLIFLLLAWWLSPYFVLFGIAVTIFATYRYVFIRNCRYLVTAEYIRVSRGLFFKRVDQVEMFRVKDYIITQSFIAQLFHYMDLTLKSTDPENPVLWLRGIPASDITDIIRDRVQQARQHNRIYELN